MCLQWLKVFVASQSTLHEFLNSLLLNNKAETREFRDPDLGIQELVTFFSHESTASKW